jgi:UDP-MurNAc hydroxylase
MNNMDIKFLGQAGLLITGKNCKLLCDPWFSKTGGFLARWHQFPSNEHIDKALFNDIDYLYVSHEHHDHFDEFFLKTLPKDTKIIIANYLTKDFKKSFEELGFTNIEELNDWEEKKLADNFEVTIVTDPGKYKEDSTLFVKADGYNILNKNDCYLSQEYMEKFSNIGIDLLFTQFSGAIWFPMVYQYNSETKQKAVQSVLTRLENNFVNIVNTINSKYVIPSAGPPCFLEDDCFDYNFVENAIFPDQSDFLPKIEQKILKSKFNTMIPGDIVSLDSDNEIIFNNTNHFDFTTKKQYLREYQKKRLPYIQKYLDDIPEPSSSLFEKFKNHMNNLIHSSQYFSSNVDQLIEFNIVGKFGGVWQIDFQKPVPEIHENSIGKPHYQFKIKSKFLNMILNDKLEWEDLFLSLRFQVNRDPDIYNGSLFALLQYGGDPNIMPRVENLDLKSKCPETIVVKSNNKNFKIQRSCPHLGEDLKNATIENGILVCPRHQWNFDLVKNGKCIKGGNKDLSIFSTTDIDDAEDSGMA